MAEPDKWCFEIGWDQPLVLFREWLIQIKPKEVLQQRRKTMKTD